MRYVIFFKLIGYTNVEGPQYDAKEKSEIIVLEVVMQCILRYLVLHLSGYSL